MIWSTKNRTPWIDKELQNRLYPYLGGIIKSHKGRLLEIGGMPDHIHLLIELGVLDKFAHFITHRTQKGQNEGARDFETSINSKSAAIFCLK